MSIYQYFWDFFSKNEQQIKRSIHDSPNEVIFMMSEELSKIHPDLAFEIYEDTEKDNMTLIISADGNFELFPYVEELFITEPSIAGWDIFKFRPALNEIYQFVELDGLEISYEDIRVDIDDEFNVTAYIKGYDGLDNRYVHAYFLLLDTLIGEYDAVTLIKRTTPLPYQKKGIPFTDLKQIIKTYREKE